MSRKSPLKADPSKSAHLDVKKSPRKRAVIESDGTDSEQYVLDLGVYIVYMTLTHF